MQHARGTNSVPANEGRGRTVLIIEDDSETARLMRTFLERAGYSVVQAETGEEGIDLAQHRTPQIIILDVMLPLRSGWETCRALRARLSVPIIMVTARRAEDDRLRGFAEGVDDYVTKPFSPRELVARVGAVLRRAERAESLDTVSIGELKVDMRRREVRLEGTVLPLRLREFDLLAYLVSRAGEVCSRADLLDHVWGRDFEGDERTIDTHIRRIRDALGDAGRVIQTVWGIGYRVSDHADH